MTAFNESDDPRTELAQRLPVWTQPIVSLISGAPAPGEAYRPKAPIEPVIDAGIRMTAGAGLSVAGLGVFSTLPTLALLLLFVGAVLTVSGMGIVQVVVFHYCGHDAVFRDRARNLSVGRAISILFAFKYFDHYRREHIQHHRAQKLITEEDEFASFVIKVCGLRPGMSRAALWARLCLILISPAFHLKFLRLRIVGNFPQENRRHGVQFIAFWALLLAVVAVTGVWMEFLVAWVLPLTFLLQIATVFRILCEHRFPDARLLAVRGKALIAEATTGVFAAKPAPPRHDAAVVNLARWAVWWLDLMTVQLFVRLVVLVGDAPAHDFHHRRPGAKTWANALHARDLDKRSGAPGYPSNYIDVWGLGVAIDLNIRALSAADASLLRVDAAEEPSYALLAE